MWTLIKKDIKNSKPVLMVLPFVLLILTGLLTSSTPINASLAIVGLMFMIISISIPNLYAKDQKSNINLLFYSLPVRRYKLVLSRYLSIILMGVLSGVFMFAYSNAMLRFVFNKPLSLEISLNFLILGTSLLLLFVGIQLLVYLAHPATGQVLSSLVYLGVLLIPLALSKVFPKHIKASLLGALSKLSQLNISLLILLAAFIFYSISCFINIKVTESKEI